MINGLSDIPLLPFPPPEGSDRIQFEPEPDWERLPDPVPSTLFAAVLKINRKTLSKYVSENRVRQPIAKGDNFASYARADVADAWRMRQVRIAQGYIKLPGVRVDPAAWGADGGQVYPLETGPIGTPEGAGGPIPGAGVESAPQPDQGGTVEDPLAGTDLMPNAGLLSLSRETFESLLLAVVERAQAPLALRLSEADARVAALTQTALELRQGQQDMIDAQRRFLEAQEAAQRQQAELMRQMMAGQQALIQEQRRLTGQVQDLTARLQTQAERDEAEKRRQAEPPNAWERFKRGLGLGGQRRGG